MCKPPIRIISPSSPPLLQTNCSSHGTFVVSKTAKSCSYLQLGNEMCIIICMLAWGRPLMSYKYFLKSLCVGPTIWASLICNNFFYLSESCNLFFLFLCLPVLYLVFWLFQLWKRAFFVFACSASPADKKIGGVAAKRQKAFL